MFACLYLLLGRSYRLLHQHNSLATELRNLGLDDSKLPLLYSLCTQTLTLRNYGSSAVASNLPAEDPQLRRLRPAVTSTAVEKIAGLVQICGVLTYCCRAR